jgi:endonuclease III
MAAANKQNLLTQVYNRLKKAYEPLPDSDKRPVLEQLIYAICREGTTSDRADQAFRNLAERFFDWNEVRVSQPSEVEEALGHLPDAGARAERIIGLLQEVFESTFSFDLETSTGVDKKGLKGAAKYLAKYQGANDYAIAWVTQQTLGGHAIPLDGPTLRVLTRLGLADSDAADPTSLEALRTSLEHLVPKARGAQLGEMLSLLARDVCWEDVPNCPECPLREDCPTGQERLRGGSNGEHRPGRLKPR